MSSALSHEAAALERQSYEQKALSAVFFLATRCRRD